MDFADVHELEHIIIPNQSVHPAKVACAENEDDIIKECVASGQIFHFSPKPSMIWVINS